MTQIERLVAFAIDTLTSLQNGETSMWVPDETCRTASEIESHSERLGLDELDPEELSVQALFGVTADEPIPYFFTETDEDLIECDLMGRQAIQWPEPEWPKTTIQNN